MPVAPDLAGAALDGRYELHALIGEGTFGRVYRGLDRRLQRSVAVKVIKPWWTDDPAWAERFEREAQLLARLSDPGIVQIFDVGHSDEGLYYVAELVRGESLAARLRRGALPVGTAVEIAAQLCRALDHSHAAGVIHRDVKPANVLITPAGQVKLGDFSLARLAEGTSEGAPTLAGTPKYMAPEQARGLSATAASDLYSVGIVLYEMLAGHPPFTGTSPVELALHHVQDAPPPLPDHVPDRVAAVVRRALEKDPARRYANGAAMRSALLPGRRGPRPDGPPPGGRTPTLDEALPPHSPRGPQRPGREDGSTLLGPRLGPRRNVNPPARRRAVALVAAVIALVAGMLVLAAVLGATSTARVPALRGLSRTSALRVLRHAGLQGSFTAGYSSATAGTVIAQAPGARVRLARGSTVRVRLSAGPPPVRLPVLTHEDQATALATLRRLGLRGQARTAPAPGTAPGIVTAEQPAAGTLAPVGSEVRLTVAEVPRWRTRMTFSGADAADSGPFQIRGEQWRILYRMSYVGTCTFVFFCDGPTAHVTGSAGAFSQDFDLSEGTGRVRTFATGPGTYRVTLTPGGDTATWTLTIQDRY